MKWRAPISYRNSLSRQGIVFIKIARRTGRPVGAHFPRKLARNVAPVSKTTVSEFNQGSQPQSNSATAVTLSHSQPAVPHKVVFGPRLGPTLLHAPETKMTWVHKQTPSNHYCEFIIIIVLTVYHHHDVAVNIIVPRLVFGFISQSFSMICFFPKHASGIKGSDFHMEEHSSWRGSFRSPFRWRLTEKT